MFEAALNFSLNKKIKIIDFSQMNLTTVHIKYFEKGFLIDAIGNVIEFNWSNNTYFKDEFDTGIILAKILEDLKN